MVDLIFFSFFLFLSKGRNDAAAGEDISSFVFLKGLIEGSDDRVDGCSDMVIEVDAIEIVIDIFDGSEGENCKVFIILMIVVR